MEEVTLILLVASIGYGGACLLVKKPSTAALSLAMVLGVLAFFAAVTDPALLASEDMALTLVALAPFAVAMYGLISLIAAWRRGRWPSAGRWTSSPTRSYSTRASRTRRSRRGWAT